jgi:hypothetical protein
MFMLPLEVMGPGGSLSTSLVTTAYWRDASRRESWHAVTAMAAYSCDRMEVALVFGLWMVIGGNRVAASVFYGDPY